jgi:uncharacterized protein YodC (DUF2158 family)
MQYFIGDVVALSNVFGEGIPQTRMTVCGFDKEGRVECVWFTRYHQLKHGAFWSRNITLSGLTISVPPNVLCEIQRWKNSTSTL